MVEQYLELSKKILGSDESRFKFNERRGLGRIYLFGAQNRYDLSEGFPLITTKSMPFKMIAHELIWFLQGDTNIKYLVDNNVHIWDDDTFNFNLEGLVKEGVFPEAYPKYSPDWEKARNEYIKMIAEDEEFAERWGDAGPIYGSQWVHWPFFTATGEIDNQGRQIHVRNPDGIDQIATTIENMKRSPKSARHVVSAWNPKEVPNMSLPPCHTLFQANSDGESLDLQLYQRACDMFLGVPFNIASYSMLTHILAQNIGLEPGSFVHTFGDVHFYAGAGERAQFYGENLDMLKLMVRNQEIPEDFRKFLNYLEGQLPPEPTEPKDTRGMDHVTGILEQLSREPLPLPTLEIADKPYNELAIDDFSLKGYESHPRINRKLAV